MLSYCTIAYECRIREDAIYNGIVSNTSTQRKNMATNITIKLENNPGELAQLREELGGA